jgi:hypothetical protein
VLENKELRKIFGPMKNEVMTVWGKVHNEEFQELYSSPSVIRITKSRRMRCEDVVRMEAKRTVCKLL